MHRHLTIAAAAAAFCGAAAHAQSGLQIWGIVDQGIVHMDDGTSTAAFPGAGVRDHTQLKAAWQNRLGFRGSESLGDGLSAFFDLEHRFSADDGIAATPFWTARSTVGLRSTRLGELILGRDYNPAFYSAVALDPFNWNTVGQMGLTYTWAGYTGNDGGPRNNNMVQLKTPKLGGFTALGMVAFAEGATNRGRAYGGNVIYQDGPWFATVAYDTASKPTASGTDARMWLGGLSYDFGIVRPRALVARSRNFSGVETRSTMFGLSAPIGRGRLLGGVTRLDPQGANNASTKWGLGYHYDLGKRTMLYTDVGSAKTDGRTRLTGYDVGIRHTF